MPKKQTTIRISDATEATVQRIIDSTGASQSTVIRAMLAYASGYEREIEAMIRNYRLVEI